MLQKLSKCEVKAWLCWNLIDLPPHSDFTWNQILTISNCPKISFLAILKVLNLDFSQFEQLTSPKFTKIQISESLKQKWHVWTVWIHQNLMPHKNWSGGKIIKYQQSQALTSQFESFWSIVQKYSVWIMIGRVSTVWVIKWCFKTRLGYFARLCKSLQIIFLMSPNDFRNRQHLEKRCKPSKRKKRVGYNYKSVNLCRWTIPKSGFRLSGSNFNYTHMPLNNHNWPPPYKKPENHPFRHISSRVVDKLKKFGLFFCWNMYYAHETFIM